MLFFEKKNKLIFSIGFFFSKNKKINSKPNFNHGFQLAQLVYAVLFGSQQAHLVGPTSGPTRFSIGAHQWPSNGQAVEVMGSAQLNVISIDTDYREAAQTQ